MKYLFATLLFLLTFLTSLMCQKVSYIMRADSTVILGPEPTSVTHPNHDTSLISQYIRTIFEDSSGNMWFGPAGESVARYRNDTLQYFESSDFFAGTQNAINKHGQSIHAIAEDRRGDLWFGTSDGLIKYDGQKFQTYNQKQGLENVQIGRQGILKDKNGLIWVGTECGVYTYDAKVDRFILFEALPPFHFNGLLEDIDGNIWFASKHKGVYLYDGKEVKNFGNKLNLSSNYAGGIDQDQHGNMWFTMKNGIARYDGRDFTSFTNRDGIEGYEFWGIKAQQGTDFIWITTRGSTTRYNPTLSTIHPDRIKTYRPEDGLNCCVQTMYQDRSGNMWWGAGDGVFRYDGDKFYKVRKVGPWK